MVYQLNVRLSDSSERWIRISTLDECPHLVSNEFPLNRAILLHHVPPLLERSEVIDLLTYFGAVESLSIENLGVGSTENLSTDRFSSEISSTSKRCMSRAMLVAFVLPCSLESLKTYDFSVAHPSLSTRITSGMVKWYQEYQSNRPNTSTVMEQVMEFMSLFDDNEARIRSELKSGPVVDESGFTLVRSKKRRKRHIRDTQQLDISKKLRRDKAALHAEANLYCFKTKFSKQNELQSIRSKFEEDKAKIRAMRNQRKFNPYEF